MWFRGDHACFNKDKGFHRFALLDANCVLAGCLSCQAHKCIHDHVKTRSSNAPKFSTKPDLYSHLDFVQGSNRRNLNSVPWNPLRIKVVSRLDSSTLSAGNKTFLTTSCSLTQSTTGNVPCPSGDYKNFWLRVTVHTCGPATINVPR